MSPSPQARADEPVLSLEGLSVAYPLESGAVVEAACGVDLTILPGEIHALVGESGAGKTTIGQAVMGLLEAPGRIVAGRATIAGRPVDARTGRAEGVVPGRDIGAVFQDPMTSLNPLFTVETQLTETMRFHLGLDRQAARARALELLRAVGIPEPERRLRSYPHQLSGGQRQRVVIAAALSCNPRLLVADEPTTALDVSIQAQILALLRDLASTRDLGTLLITHNLGVVAEIADRVTIMQRGRVVESGPVAEVLRTPSHPYSRLLLGAVPRLGTRRPRFPVPGAESETASRARAALASTTRTSVDEGAGPILEVEDLCVTYRTGGRIPFMRGPGFRAVDGVSLRIGRGEIYGLVGESGCGKTTLAHAVAGLVSPNAGRIRLDGHERSGAGHAGRILQMIFQDPYSSLNARMRIGDAIAEPILFHRLAPGRAAAREEVARLLEAVGLDADSAQRFPFAFSGGQRQRLSIARALAARPRLLVCDEPTSSLDVSVQAQILNLLKDLRDTTGMAILFISHDLAVVRQMCDRIGVMRAGRIVEEGDGEALFGAPRHAYTRELISLVPSLDRIWRDVPSETIEGAA